MQNLLTDIPGVRVGHAHDAALASGVTAILFDQPAVAAIDIRGGGPGVREDALLDPANTVERVDGIALSGGSAFGLEAASGIQAWLAEQGRGFAVRDALIPIVPGAIVFDLLNGGNKAWGRYTPYRELGYAAAAAASTTFALGSVGAGLGATTANLQGGLGSASATTTGGIKVAAIVVVNAVGSVTVGDGPWFWAAPYEIDGEFGGRGLPAAFTPDMLAMRIKGGPAASASENTTISLVVTDAILTKAQAKRLAMMAQTGMARAIYPVHLPLDGDIVFAAAACTRPIEPLVELSELGMVAANVLARAIARGVYHASPLPFAGALPSWQGRFGS
ncbi:P1 family peptidase [Bradyrhizobium sp. HKCCYLRH1030]|uniref:P1 family peptidase n=1 Tax=Bradyrhizobium sp. HKCCYLRH1030 TaxID=3420744 RepID=UPI003EBA66D9